MAKIIKLPGKHLGLTIVKECILFSDNTALLLLSFPDGDAGWEYFNPETGELIEEKNGL